MRLKDLEVYQISLGLSDKAWQIYDSFEWQLKKVIGDQFIRSIDSIGANIAEGFGRYHYLDKCKFYYNARGSLFEAGHWLLLLKKRDKISKEAFAETSKVFKKIHQKLNGLIKGTKQQIGNS